MADLLTEVNTAHNPNGQRSLGRNDSAIKRIVVDAVVHKPDGNGNPGYIFSWGYNTIRFQDSDAASMEALKAGLPAAIGITAKLELDPKADVEYKYDPKNKCYHLLSIRQRPGAPKPVVKLPSWAKTYDEIPFAEWRAGEAWAKEVLGDDLSTWPSKDECLTKLDEKRVMPPSNPTKPAVVQEETKVSEIPFGDNATDDLLNEIVAEDVDPHLPQPEYTGPKWTADTSKPGQSQNIAAWKHFENYCFDIDDKISPPKELKIALDPYVDIPAAIEVLGWPTVRNKLQARLDYLKTTKSTPVDTKEIPTVTDNAGLANKTLTAQDWAAFLADKQVKSAAMLKALGLKKLSEWHGTLEDAWSVYVTKTTPVVLDEPPDVADQDGEPAESEDVNEMEADYNDPEPPAALAPLAKPQPVDVTPIDRTPREVAVVSHPTAMSPFVEQWQVMRQQAAVFIKSGFLPKEINTPEKAITIMMMGNALHVDPIVALNNINVVNGKAAVSPQLMMGLVRRSGQLESFKCTDDGNACTVVIKRRGEPAHTEVFSMADAAAMNLINKDNWKKQPATMRKWRAISAAVRVTFSDVAWGLASYTAEELNPDIAVDYSE